MHVMKLEDTYYNLLKSGKKTIELRLFDDKRQKIKLKDQITFFNIKNQNESLKTIVLNLYKAENFEKLCDVIDIFKTGFNSKEELVKVLLQFYPIQKQIQFGVLGIELKII